jgi:putative ABC transport system substrate-binding protein
MPVVGNLSNGSARYSATALALAAFRQGLGEAGYAEGHSVTIEYRWAEFQNDRLSALAADLVSCKVDVIVTSGGDSCAFAAKTATSTIPIVSVFGGDPVMTGLVDSLARPGSNLTGVTILTADLMPKRLELLSDLVPQVGIIGLLVNKTSHPEQIIRDVQEAARAKGVHLQILKASAEGEFATAFTSLIQSRAGALLVGNDPFVFSRRDQLVALVARYAIPAIYEWREFTVAGGLIRYGTRPRRRHV